jgi:hypothetical protein
MGAIDRHQFCPAGMIPLVAGIGNHYRLQPDILACDWKRQVTLPATPAVQAKVASIRVGSYGESVSCIRECEVLKYWRSERGLHSLTNGVVSYRPITTLQSVNIEPQASLVRRDPLRSRTELVTVRNHCFGQ